MIGNKIKQVVKTRYGKFAETGGSKEFCWPSKQQSSSGYAVGQGLYSAEILSTIPEIALNLSRGCGNPTGFANPLQIWEIYSSHFYDMIQYAHQMNQLMWLNHMDIELYLTIF